MNIKWREDTRQEKRREDRRQEERKSKTREETRRREREMKDFFLKKFSRRSNSPDELAQNVSKKKNLSDELFLHFFFESSESDRGFNYVHDSNSICRAGGIKSIQKGVFGYAVTGKTLHGSICLSLVMKKLSVSRTRRSSYFSDSVLCFGKKNENPQSNTVWDDKLTWFKSSPQHRALDTIDGEPMEFEWNIFTGFTTQLCNKV